MHRRCIPPVGKFDHPFEAEQYLARCPLHRCDHPWGPRASSAEALDLHHCMLESTRPEDLVRTEQFFSVPSSQLVDSLSSSFSLKPNDAATTSKLRRPPPRRLARFGSHLSSKTRWPDRATAPSVRGGLSGSRWGSGHVDGTKAAGHGRLQGCVRVCVCVCARNLGTGAIIRQGV